MTDPKAPAAAQPTAAAPQSSPTPAPTPEPTPAAPAAAPTLSIVTSSRTLEQNREIRAAFTPFLDRHGIRAVYDDVMEDPAISVDAARTRLLTALGKDVTPANPGAHAITDTRAGGETERQYGNRVGAMANRKSKAAA